MATPAGDNQQAAVNQGGHGAIRPIGDGSILAKNAPQGSIENEFYARIRQGRYPHLTPVVPASYTADQVRYRQPQVTEPLDDRTHVYFENIAQGDVKKLDTKVGDKTSSRRELMEQHDMSRTGAALKEIKLSIADLATGSSQRGWRVVGGTDAPESRLRAGMNSQDILRSFSEDPQVWDQLIGKMEAIRAAAQQTDIGFIASSVFSVHGNHNGNEVVEAKLIDFAHVIDADRPLTQTADLAAADGRQNSPEQSTSTPETGNGAGPTTTAQGSSQTVNWTEMKDKYRSKFLEGMGNLIADAKAVREEKRQATVAGAANMRVSAATATAGSSAQPTAVPAVSTSSQQVLPRR
ncbi:inositol polyphosphate kinase family protein [Streptomyces sp. NPDC002889]|uniref:inositol polyphosphate kinase family protein n=1 Tax=Streptomyces sp. NPDC002889 TaxID=3364669 RepID=UPI0036845342